MSLKGYIKIKLGSLWLPKRAAKVVRTKIFSNFETARNIAVLFDATDTDNNTCARFLTNFFIENKIKFRALGFAKPYDVEDTTSAYSNTSFFTENSFDLTGVPVESVLEEFIRTDFDILIDINIKPNYFINAVVALSEAKMKLGLRQNDKGYYDFMIDLNDNSFNCELFVEQLKHYLKIIKT